jgi:hypothetical protein
MRKINKGRVLLYLAFLAAMIFSGWQLGTPSMVGAATCCSYGIQCTGKTKDGESEKCCMPTTLEANCSLSKPNYCRAVCL